MARHPDLPSLLSTRLSRGVDDLFALVGLSRRHRRFGPSNHGTSVILLPPPPPLPLLPSVLPSRRCCCTNTLRHTIVMPQAERKKERARIKKLREKEKKVTPFPSQPHTEWHSNTCPHISSYPLQFRTHSLYIYSTGCRSEGASSNRRGQMERRETPFGRPGQRSRPSGGSVRGAESSGNVFDGGCCVV